MDLHLNWSSLAVAELEKGPVIAALYPVVFFWAGGPGVLVGHGGLSVIDLGDASRHRAKHIG